MRYNKPFTLREVKLLIFLIRYPSYGKLPKTHVSFFKRLLKAHEDATEYRCSCCNKLKPSIDQYPVSFSPENKTKVYVCHACNEAIKRSKSKTVTDYRNKAKELK